VVKVHRIRLETERLILRDLQEDDAQRIAELIAPLNVSRFLAVVPHPYSLANAVEFITKEITGQAKEPRESVALAITSKGSCLV